MVNLDRIADKLAKKLTQVNTSDTTGSFAMPRTESIDYEKIHNLKKVLIEEYRDKKIEDVFTVEKIENDYGRVHRIENKAPFDVDLGRNNRRHENIYQDLKLIEGIGPITEEKLKSDGYNSIKDLKSHPKWEAKAESFLDKIASDEHKLYECIKRWKNMSDPLILDLADRYEEKDFVIFDVESLGLFSKPIILFGIARPEAGDIKVDQFLVDDIKNEPAALVESKNILSHRKALLTFNGKAFDIPYLKQRLNFYGFPEPEMKHIHFDLLHLSRRKWRNSLMDCSLETIEREIFGIKRKIDIPSSLVPDFYRTYSEENNIGPLVPIIEHNKQDLLSLVNIFHNIKEVE